MCFLHISNKDASVKEQVQTGNALGLLKKNHLIFMLEKGKYVFLMHIIIKEYFNHSFSFLVSSKLATSYGKLSFWC